MTTPIWKDTKRLGVTKLIKFTIITTNKLFIDAFIYGISSLVPEFGVAACRIVLTANVKVGVLSAGFVDDIVFLDIKGSSCVQVAFKAEQITETLVGRGYRKG